MKYFRFVIVWQFCKNICIDHAIIFPFFFFLHFTPFLNLSAVPLTCLHNLSFVLTAVLSIQRSYGDRALAVAAPRLWNALPIHMRQPGFSLATSKKCLKIYLFKKAFFKKYFVISCDFCLNYLLMFLINVVIIFLIQYCKAP